MAPEMALSNAGWRDWLIAHRRGEKPPLPQRTKPLARSTGSLAGVDLPGYRKGALEFLVEEPHRIEDFAEAHGVLARSACPKVNMLLFRRYFMMVGSETR